MFTYISVTLDMASELKEGCACWIEDELIVSLVLFATNMLFGTTNTVGLR